MHRGNLLTRIVHSHQITPYACQSARLACVSPSRPPCRPSLLKFSSTHPTNIFHISPMRATLVPSTSQPTFGDALRVYKKRIKVDLLLHPLAVKLQPCDSPHAVISILQEQARAIDLTKLLHPTVNVIYHLSSILQEDVGLVNIGARSLGTCPVPSFLGIIPSESHFCWLRCPLLSMYFPAFPCIGPKSSNFF